MKKGYKIGLIIGSFLFLIILSLGIIKFQRDNTFQNTVSNPEKNNSYQEVITLPDKRVVYSRYQDNTKLKEQLEKDPEYLDNLVKISKKIAILKDGGSIVYQNGSILIVMCHRMFMDANVNDIYITTDYHNTCYSKDELKN